MNDIRNLLFTLWETGVNKAKHNIFVPFSFLFHSFFRQRKALRLYGQYILSIYDTVGG